MLRLLRITDTSQLRDTRFYKPQSDDEIRSHKERTPGSIEVTAAKFTLDLSRSRNTLFNKCAKSVFAQDFIQKVTQDKWYSYPPIPARYLDPYYVTFTLHGQMKNLVKAFNATDPGKRADRLKQVAKQNRKRTVCSPSSAHRSSAQLFNSCSGRGSLRSQAT